MLLIQKAQFAPGQMVTHRDDGYLGLIFDVDPIFHPNGVSATRESQADLPWYYLLVDGEEEARYVSETDLNAVDFTDEFTHPLKDRLFEDTDQGEIVSRYQIN